MPKSPNPDIIDKIYFRNIYSCQRKIYWYKVKVMETINAVWEHSYGEDCIPNFSANMEQPRHRWYEFKEGFSLTLVERAIRETKKDNKSTSFTVLDPFSGSGTSPLTALQSRCNAIGYEVNPFMSFVGKTKCQQRTKSIHDYTKELNRILVQRPFRLKSPLEGVSTFTGSGENGKWLFNLDVLRAYEALYQHISLSEYKDFFLLALITSAMQCCNAKKDAERADELAREIQKVNSRIRNVQWEISKQSARLTTLIEEKSKTEEARPHYASEDEASAQNEYEEIIKELEEGESYHQGYTKERQQIYARITELTVEKVRLRKEYEEHYAELYAGNGHLYRNPIIMALTSDGCPICHTAHQKLPEHIEQALNQNVCPLCGEHIPETASEQTEIIAKLAKIDNNLSKIEHELEELILRQQTVEEQLDNLKKKIEELKKRKEDIEKKCYSFLLDDATDDSWSSRIKALQDSISAVEREKFKHIEDRDQLKMEYDNLCVSLEKIYRRVQVDFLPIFKKFAKEFTGLDLDMTLVSVTDDGRKMFKFILQIDDTNRDNEFELSESQRFFIDIALRMAIVTFVCSKTTASTSMLIDTPEGSLDIAYETNAGSMFYEYIAANQKMIITANLNSSGLIQTLAGKTKFEKFELISMLKWAKLSSVQNTHFELFERSISTIESKLEG